MRADRRDRGARDARRARRGARRAGALGARRAASCCRRRRGRSRGSRARPGGWARRAARAARARGACSRVGLAVAAIGWVVDTQTEVRSDLQALVPQDLPAVRDLETLQRTTGVAGEVDVVVEGRDLTDPKVVAWMRAFQQRVLKQARYTPENGCGKADAVPGAVAARPVPGRDAASDRAQIDALLDAVPPYFSQAVITADRRTANLAFGIRLMPLDEQHEVIERMRAALDPPAGRDRAVAGLPVLAAEANAALASPWRRLGTLLAGLLAVGARAARRPPARRARVGAARPDRAGDGLVGGGAVRAADPAQPDVGDARRARDRDLDRVRGAARRPLPRGARRRPRPGRGAAAHLPLDGRGGARVGRDRDRGLRRARVLRRADAAGVRHRDRRRPVRLAARRARRAAGGARAGRAPARRGRGARAAPSPIRPCPA